MNITVKMNCGSENEIECLRLAKAVMETGCLNFEQEYAKEIMPSIKISHLKQTYLQKLKMIKNYITLGKRI
jgi:hypothetical protein